MSQLFFLIGVIASDVPIDGWRQSPGTDNFPIRASSHHTGVTLTLTTVTLMGLASRARVAITSAHVTRTLFCVRRAYRSYQPRVDARGGMQTKQMGKHPVSSYGGQCSSQ